MKRMSFFLKSIQESAPGAVAGGAAAYVTVTDAGTNDVQPAMAAISPAASYADDTVQSHVISDAQAHGASRVEIPSASAHANAASRARSPRLAVRTAGLAAMVCLMLASGIPAAAETCSASPDTDVMFAGTEIPAAAETHPSVSGGMPAAAETCSASPDTGVMFAGTEMPAAAETCSASPDTDVMFAGTEMPAAAETHPSVSGEMPAAAETCSASPDTDVMFAGTEMPAAAEACSASPDADAMPIGTGMPAAAETHPSVSGGMPAGTEMPAAAEACPASPDADAMPIGTGIPAAAETHPSVSGGMPAGTEIQTAAKKQQLPPYKDATLSIDTRVTDLMSRMTLQEKIAQLNQYTLGRNDNVNNLDEVVTNIPGETGSLIYFGDDAELRNTMQKKAVEGTRLGIPILFGFDVIHGFRTVYPIPLALGATWNPELAGQACRVAAQEAYDAGIDWTFSPMVDIARDPRWGRIAEGYGEDPYLTSVFGAASVKAYQGDDLSQPYNIAACLKHYVGYGASEAGRDYVPTEISRQTLWDTYLPPFEAGVKAGAATLMSSFNNISGTPGSANRYTMTDVLKEKWGHDGFVVADWNAVVQLINQGMAEDGKAAAMYAINAGLDMDMVDNLYMQHLEDLVAEGKVSEDRIDDAVRRVLTLKFRLGLFDNPYTEEKPESERILLPRSLEIAEQAAIESMVLLKNDSDILPLSAGLKIALIGPMAKNQADLLGSWYGRGRAEDVVSIFDGLKEVFGTDPAYAQGCDFDSEIPGGFEEAVETASQADVVVLCLGEKRSWSGENASRSTIALPGIQEELLMAVKETGKPVVVLLSNGRSLDLTRISPAADAVLEIWQPGVMAGKAVASILTGESNPSGRLTVTFPYTTGQIPIYYNRRDSGRRGTQGLYQDIPSTPMYEFGYGLSYTDYEYGQLTVSADSFTVNDTVTASITVRNAGQMDGKETVQWYICDPYSTLTRPVKELKHFEKKLLKAGEEYTFTFEIDPARDLSFVNADGERFVEAGDYYIIVKDKKVKITLTDGKTLP